MAGRLLLGTANSEDSTAAPGIAPATSASAPSPPSATVGLDEAEEDACSVRRLLRPGAVAVVESLK